MPASDNLLPLDLLVPVSNLTSKTCVRSHLSYSEIVCWMDCHQKHKLKYIDSISLDAPSIHTDFGHVIHTCLQEFIKSRTMPSLEFVEQEFTKKMEASNGLLNYYDYGGDAKEFLDSIRPILEEVPRFLEENFKDWEYVAAEQQLFESMVDDTGNEQTKFKGYIDGIIKYPKSSRLKTGKSDEYEYLILDWKCTGWGWSADKQRDPKKQMQLVLYKHFWSKKMNIDLSNIRCGFVLLTRKGKKRCSLIPVSVGPKTTQNALNTINVMLGSLKKGMFPKNRNSCRFCEYSNTEHCTG